jgi:hypothetical protein
MADTTTTPFSKKCEILNDLFLYHSDEEEWEGFDELCNIGLPLAYLIHEGIVKTTPRANLIIDETWGIMLGWMGIEDTGFDSFISLNY